MRQQAGPGPRIAGIVAGGQLTLGEIDQTRAAPASKGLPDVAFALVDQGGLSISPAS